MPNQRECHFAVRQWTANYEVIVAMNQNSYHRNIMSGDRNAPAWHEVLWFVSFWRFFRSPTAPASPDPGREIQGSPESEQASAISQVFTSFCRYISIAEEVAEFSFLAGKQLKMFQARDGSGSR